MADRIIKFKRGATATAQKAQKKGGEDQTSSFGQDVSAELALDMEKWNKESEEREAQKAQEEDDEEFRPQIIPRGVPSTSRPPATVMSTTPNEKRQKVTDPKLGATSFQQLYTATTGQSLDDLMDQEVLVPTDQGGKAQERETKEDEPPPFVRGSIKARRLWIAGFSFEDIDVKVKFPRGKDIAVLAVNKDGEDVYLTADDGITLYTKEFVELYGKAVLVEKDEDNYWCLEEAAQNLCDLLNTSPTSDYFGAKAEESPVSEILAAQYDLARSTVLRYEFAAPKDPTPMPTLMAPWTSINPMMAGQPHQMVITQQVSAKEPTIAGDITLEDLVRLKTEYAEYIRGNMGQPCNKIDRYLTSGAARSLETMTPVGMSTMERIDYHINTIQSGYGATHQYHTSPQQLTHF
jgi:hypothetical protein